MKKTIPAKRRPKADVKAVSIPRIIAAQYLRAGTPKAFVHRFLLKFYSQMPLLALGFLFLAGPAAAASLVSSQPEASKLVSTEGQSKLAQDAAKATKAKEAKKAEALKKEAKKAVLPVVDKEDLKAEGMDKFLKGRVSGANNFGLAVEFGEDPKMGLREAWFNLHSKTTLSGFKSMSELGVGDSVDVSFRELKESRKRILKSVTRTAKYVEPVVAEAPAEEVPAAETEKA